LAAHPAVAQVAVVGVADERMGEVGCACVIAREGAALDGAELVAWSRRNMANYKVPRYVLAFDAFPLNASNKIVKRELARIASARLASADR
ncbi:MAG TPA: fatty acid--CoA ligase, partial [Massilia sp.]|nr:fatty acid--CoA ligase [Massilia sp.]